MTQTDKKRKFIVDVVYIVLLVLMLVLFLEYAFYPLLPIFIALIVALILQRPMKFLNKKFKIPKAIIAVLLVFILLALIGFVVYVIGENDAAYILFKDGVQKSREGNITSGNWKTATILQISG